MKTCWFFFAFFVATSIGVSDIDDAEMGRVGLDVMVRDAIESLRLKLKEGIPEAGIPPLDPLDMKYQEINLKMNDTMRLSGSVSNVTGHNLMSFNISKLKVSVIPISFEIGLDWNAIDTRGYYDIDGHLLNIIPVYGNGTFEGNFNGSYFTMRIDIGTKGGSLCVKKLNVDFGLKNVDIRIENFLGGTVGDIICELVNENLPTWIEQFKIRYLPPIKEFIMGIINKMLEGKTADDIIKFIEGLMSTTTASPLPTTTPTY